MSLKPLDPFDIENRLVRDDAKSFFVPAYLGAKGWIAIRLDLDGVDWDTVSELALELIKQLRRGS